MKGTFSISMQNAGCIKGLLCVGILLHHLAQRTQLAFLQPLCAMGALFVAGFFFLSGYGVKTKLNQKGPAYWKGFMRRHILKIALPYAAITLLYALCYLPIGKGASLASILHSLVSGDPFVPFSWYALCIPLLYTAFAASFRPAASPKAGILRFTLLLLGYILICLTLGYGEWWYLSCPAFLLGILYADGKGARVLLLALAALPLCAAALLAAGLRSAHPAGPALKLCKMAGICAVSAAAFSLFALFPLRHRALSWLGERSLYFYLLQGLPINLLRNQRFYLSSDLLFSALCILLTIGLAALAYRAAKALEHCCTALTSLRYTLPEPPPQS